jgi:hypothetical protein
MSSYQSYVQKNKSEINKTTIVSAYDDFMYANKTKLEEQFYEINKFQTSIRGVKIRGVYGDTKEAEIKARKLQQKDKYHNIFMAEVGKWTPWDPAPHEVKDQSYNNDQLNNLMKSYKENEDSREQFFEERTRGAKKVVGASTASSSSESFDSMFGPAGDLALQRKVEEASSSEDKKDE